jgi:hypothetical protein
MSKKAIVARQTGGLKNLSVLFENRLKQHVFDAFTGVM